MEEIESYPSAQNQLNHMVARFVADNDGPDSLLIVYYSGLSLWTENDGTMLHNQKCKLKLGPQNSARWNVVEQSLLHGPKGDILEIFDASYMSDPGKDNSIYGEGSVVLTRLKPALKSDLNPRKGLPNSTSDTQSIRGREKTADKHTNTRTCRLLTSSGSTCLLSKPEPRFFTAALIESLTQLVNERSKFPTTYQGYTFRKVPQDELQLGVKVGWKNARRIKMPISSNELEKRLRERPLKTKRTVSDEFMALTSENQRAQVKRLVQEKEIEEEDPYMEWTLASVEARIIQVGRKLIETVAINVILQRRPKDVPLCVSMLADRINMQPRYRDNPCLILNRLGPSQQDICLRPLV